MFKYIQTFFLDSSSVKNASEAGISRIDLYFRAKPRAINNRSGIQYPGVEVSIVPVIGGIPNINETDTIRPTEPTEHGARFAPRFEIARKEWAQIVATNDASIPTAFVFDSPMFVNTKQEYGILIKYDGNEDFILWENKIGDHFLGTNKPSQGVSDRNVGRLFSFIGGPASLNNLTPQSNTGLMGTQSNLTIPVITPDNKFLQTNWKAISNIDLKFKVFVARYAHNGEPVASNTTIINSKAYAGRFADDNVPVKIANNIYRLTAPSIPEEFISFDVSESTFGVIPAGTKVYQSTFHWPGGKASPLTIRTTAGSLKIIANGSYVLSNGSTFAAANGFFNIYDKSNNEFIIVDNGTTVDVRKVTSVINSTALIVDRPIKFNNTAAKFMIAPVAEMAGIATSYVDGETRDIMILSKSNANLAVRFTNNQILTLTVNAGGTSYANSDYIVINGFENVTNKVVGGYPAIANLVTNSTGGITNFYLTNTGCGFVNTSWITGANVVIKNANNANSTGSGATIYYTIGANLRTESNNITTFANCIVMNMEASRIKPEITVNNPLGTSFAINHRTLFYSNNDSTTFSKKAYYTYSNNISTNIKVKIFKSHDTGKEETKTALVPSRSNQFVIPYSNGALPNTSVIGENYSNSSVYLFDVSSNNDYIAPFIEPEIINSHFSKYVINNDYTDEHTNYGNAYAKHVATKINFNNERQAEDLLVYLSAYRPVGTDLKVYARIHNRLDPDAFDDKDWTLMEITDGVGLYSSTTDSSDYIELTYNFVNSPNVESRLLGTVEIANTTTTTITGSGTTFVSQLAVDDLVKITQPLFSTNSFAIALVNSITNSSSFTITDPISNNGMVGTGLIIEKITTYKHQAFNNVLNDNIVRYYNSEMQEFDTFDSFQIKVVMTSPNEFVIPKIDDMRGIGVTA